MQRLIRITLILSFAAGAFFLSNANTIELSAFADTLFQNGRFSDAVLEYERLLFFHKEHEKINEWKFRLAHCRKENGAYEKASSLLSEIPRDALLGDSARYLMADCAIIQKKPEKIDAVLSGINTDKSLFIRGYAGTLLQDNREDNQYWIQIQENSTYRSKADRIIALRDSLIHFKGKRYFIAGALSVVPGLGHLYTSRTGDGIFSFLTVGTLSAISAYYYSHGAKYRSAATGILGGIFYTGSIYGALMSVKIYNREKTDSYKKRMDEIYWKK